MKHKSGAIHPGPEEAGHSTLKVKYQKKRKFQNTFEELECGGVFQRLDQGTLVAKDYSTIKNALAKLEDFEYYYDQLFEKLMPLMENKQLNLPNSVLETLDEIVQNFLEFQPLPKPKLPILCLDFDGVVHSYTSGWQGIDNIPDGPVEGALEFIIRAQQYFSVNVYSSRSYAGKGVDAMEKWFIRHLSCIRSKDETYKIMNKIRFPRVKPSAMITIDDRAFRFTGTWPLMIDLINFKTWQQY